MRKLTMLFAAAFYLLIFPNSLSLAQAEKSPLESLYEQNTMSVLWFQKSGEAKALYYQGYYLGKLRLDEILSKKPKRNGLKPAIVLDIDETVLDNSPYHAWMVQTGKGDPIDWSDWFNRAEAKPLPGALDFLKYAESRGVEIFYISNRKEAHKEATIKNLQMVGAPKADKEHVLLQQKKEIGKEIRREQVAKDYDIVLLFGDNLGDFKGFDQLSVADRMKSVDRINAEFGSKFIVFPNPMYGDWEGAIYDYDLKKAPADYMKIRKDNLQSFEP